MNRASVAVLAAAAVAGATLLGHPVGLGISVVAVALCAIAAVAVARRDAWSVAWWVPASPRAGWRHTLQAAGIGVLLLSVFVPLFASADAAFALSDPDGRIAERNVDRFERTGRIDTSLLAGLGPDAAPALMRLPPHLRACTTAPMRRELATPDGLAGLNAGRARARRALRVLGAPVGAPCS